MRRPVARDEGWDSPAPMSSHWKDRNRRPIGPTAHRFAGASRGKLTSSSSWPARIWGGVGSRLLLSASSSACCENNLKATDGLRCMAWAMVATDQVRRQGPRQRPTLAAWSASATGPLVQCQLHDNCILPINRQSLNPFGDRAADAATASWSKRIAGPTRRLDERSRQSERSNHLWGERVETAGVEAKVLGC
jgi:hypothetical protein